MKKKLMKVSVAICFFLGITSCGKKNNTDLSETKTDASGVTSAELEMKAFMVGGIYAMYGFGGVAQVEKMISKNGDEKEDLIKAYKEIMIFSFLKEDGEDSKKTLKDYWEVDSKETLIKCLDDLKNNKNLENPHKAWDYARLVNNVNMAYAASYLTEDESKKYVLETLKLAQTDFKSWEDFLKDFNQGRIIWNTDAEDASDFMKISGQMLQNELYKALPLN